MIYLCSYGQSHKELQPTPNFLFWAEDEWMAERQWKSKYHPVWMCSAVEFGIDTRVTPFWILCFLKKSQSCQIIGRSCHIPMVKIWSTQRNGTGTLVRVIAKARTWHVVMVLAYIQCVIIIISVELEDIQKLVHVVTFLVSLLITVLLGLQPDLRRKDQVL